MGELSKFSERSFCGVTTLPPILGLIADIRHGVRSGPRYSYIVYLDGQGVKWKIVPTIVAKSGKISALHLYHRNSAGRRGSHSPGHSAWGTHEGLRDLVQYIHHHEEYEAAGRALTSNCGNAPKKCSVPWI